MLTFVLSSVLYILVIRTSSGSPLTSRTRVECDPGMYYDPAIGRCDTCSVICDYADIQGTVDECNTKCPDYNTKLSTTQPDVKTSSTTVKSSHRVEDGHVIPATSLSDSSTAISTESKTIVLLIVTLCVVAVTMSVVILILIVWKVRGDKTHRKEIHRLINVTPTPIYKRGLIQHMNGDSCVKSVLLPQDHTDP